MLDLEVNLVVVLAVMGVASDRLHKGEIVMNL